MCLIAMIIIMTKMIIITSMMMMMSMTMDAFSTESTAIVRTKRCLLSRVYSPISNVTTCSSILLLETPCSSVSHNFYLI